MQRLSEQLEKEAEQIRAQLSMTLEELRQRISPSLLVAPLSVVLLGAGGIWVLFKRLFREPAKEELGRSAGHSTLGHRSTVGWQPILITGFGVLTAAAIAAFLTPGEIEASPQAEDWAEKTGPRLGSQTAARSARSIRMNAGIASRGQDVDVKLAGEARHP